MRLRAVLTGVVLTCVAGCSGGQSNDRADTIAPKTSGLSATSDAGGTDHGAGPLTEAQAKAALVTVADLPSGYKVESDDDDDDDDVPLDDCSRRFDALTDDKHDAAVKAKALFSKGGAFGSFLAQSIESFPTSRDLNARFDAFEKVASECSKFKDRDKDGTVNTYTLSALSFPKLGDRTLAFGLKMESGDFTITLDYVVVLVGSAVQYIASGGLAGSDFDTLEMAARVSTARLEAAS